MTTDDLRRLLHLSDDQIHELRHLAQELKAFDAKIKMEAPAAHALALGPLLKQADGCILLIARLLNITPQEAEELLDQLLDARGQLTGFSYTARLALSQLLAQNKP